MGLYNGSTVYEEVSTSIHDGFGGFTKTGVSYNPIPCNASPITSAKAKEVYGVDIKEGFSMVTMKGLQVGAIVKIDDQRYEIKKAVPNGRQRVYVAGSI